MASTPTPAAASLAVQKDATSTSGVAAASRLAEIRAQVAKEQEEKRHQDDQRKAEEVARKAAKQKFLAEAKAKVELVRLPSDYGRCGPTNMNGVGLGPVWRCGDRSNDSYMTGPLCDALASEQGLVVTTKVAQFPDEGGYFCMQGAHAE